MQKKPVASTPGPTVDEFLTLAQSIPSMIERHKGAMTAAQLGRFLGLSPKTIYQRVKSKTIPAYDLDGAIRFDPKTVAGWLRNRMTMPRKVA